MKIAMVSSEILPFAKTGGLADVVGTLADALAQRGHQLTLIMPAYGALLQSGLALEETSIKVSVAVADRQEEGAVFALHKDRAISVYFVRADRYFDRPFLYGTAEGDYPDNAERFVFFARAALEISRYEPVDVLHCHDWQSALAIVFLRTQAERYRELRETKSVLTVHNLGFQGLFPPSTWPLLNLDWSFFTPSFLEFYGNVNFLKGGLIFADKITTVSPSYAQEIMESEQGFGLEGVISDRRADLVGILNGVDYSQWNPETDPFLVKHYSAKHLTGKQSCKKFLQRTFQLPESSKPPLLGMVSRLTSQKGVDLIEQIFEPLMARDLQWVLLGSGEPRFEEFFTGAAARHPAKFAVRIGYDEALAHQIEGGADIFLMPSRYEPCGLNQMFSLKYGTIPVVRAIGGLKDTVENFDKSTGTGTGFVFGPYDSQELLGTIDRALEVYRQKHLWTALRRRAMKKDFSWTRSAQMNDQLYRQLVNPDRERAS